MTYGRVGCASHWLGDRWRGCKSHGRAGEGRLRTHASTWWWLTDSPSLSTHSPNYRMLPRHLKLQGGDPMHRLMSTGAIAGILAAALAASPAAADIKIGTIYDYTGPFAAGGSKPAAIGN